jgi:hypothetical protein
MQPTRGGGNYSLKHIILSATVVVLTAAMIALSSLSVTAQESGQYVSGDQYAAPQAAQGSSVICAPWSKSWDISEGEWTYQWYRWCVDTSVYDPSEESSWYIEWGDKQLGDKVNLCPGTGSCTMTPGGRGMQMSTTNTS